MKKKKIFFVIIAFFIMTFLIFTGRKFYIINKIQNNLIEKSNYTNYSYKRFEYVGIINDNYWYDYRRLGDIRIVETNKGITQLHIQDDGSYYFDNENKKYFKSDYPSIETFDYHFSSFILSEEENSWLYQFKIALKSKINITEYKEKECYEIIIKQTKGNPTIICYVDKNTVLPLANGMIEMDTNKFLITTEYEIQFDTQKAEDFEKEKIFQGFIQFN